MANLISKLPANARNGGQELRIMGANREGGTFQIQAFSSNLNPIIPHTQINNLTESD
jgi:hypothetical protein